MKNLYPVFICMLFIACEKEPPPPTVITSPNDIHYEYDLLYEVDHDGVEYELDTYGSMNNADFPDSLWRFGTGEFANSSTDGAANIYNLTEGNFTINTIHEWTGGYTDSIFGSGYFDEDTMYMDYTFINMESGKEGTVHVHSY